MFRSIFRSILAWIKSRKQSEIQPTARRIKGNWRITLRLFDGSKELFIGYGRKSFFVKIEHLLRWGFKRYQIFGYQRNQHGKCYRFSILRYQISNLKWVWQYRAL